MKKISIHILAFFLKGSIWIKRRAGPIILSPFRALGRGFFVIVVPPYQLLLSVKRTLVKFYSPFQKKHGLIHPFSRRYIIHVIMVVLSFLVSAANLNALEVKPDDIGYDNLISRMVQDEFDVITEEGPLSAESLSTHYLERLGVEKYAYIDYDDLSEQLDPAVVTRSGAMVKPILSPGEIDARHRDEIVIHTVQPGETISDIAEGYGVSLNTVLWENNLTAYSIIRPGQALTILPASGIRHKVAKGDTLESIGKKYSTTPDEIIDFNKLASANDIKIGELLIIPGGKRPEVVRTYVPRWSAPSEVLAPSNTADPGKILWPSTCKRISQYYHLSHHGVDIACGYNNNIRAAAAGTVIKAQGGWNGGYGLMVVIEHSDGRQTLYGHLGKILVQEGDEVESGQTIGKEGSTGRSTGPHVHFEYRVNGRRLNPLSILTQ